MYRATPKWQGSYFPPGYTPRNYAPLPRPFTMNPKRKCGLGAQAIDIPGLYQNFSIDAAGNLVGSDNSVLGNCADVTTWLLYPACWANSIPQWAGMAQLPVIPGSVYSPPPAPTNEEVAEAVDTGTESNLINSLIASSTAQTQANIANWVKQNVPDNPLGCSTGCDASSDALGCVLCIPTWGWALIGSGALFLIWAVKK